MKAVKKQTPCSTSNGRLRVLHIGKFYPPYTGGMETHLQSLCNAMRDLVNLDVVVANDDRNSSEETIDGVCVTRLGTLLSVSAAPVCPGMARRIRESKADIVHIHLPNPTAILAYLASGRRGPLVFTYHSDIIRQRVLGRAFQPILDKALSGSDAIIATSPNYIESSRVLSRHRDRCRIIPLGIALKNFAQPEVAAKIRRQYGPRIIISVGRLIYYKGFEHLIRAMRKVDARLLIAGEGPLRSSLEREAERCGVRDRVVFLGEVADVAPYYHAADLFALASTARSEAFGIVQVEAMACSLPVVNTRLASGVPYVSLDGITGLTVPPANSDALACAINFLLDNPDRRREFGEAARRRVEQEFSIERMTERTFNLYGDVMKMPHNPRQLSAPITSLP